MENYSFLLFFFVFTSLDVLFTTVLEHNPSNINKVVRRNFSHSGIGLTHNRMNMIIVVIVIVVFFYFSLLLHIEYNQFHFV